MRTVDLLPARFSRGLFRSLVFLLPLALGACDDDSTVTGPDAGQPGVSEPGTSDPGVSDPGGGIPAQSASPAGDSADSNRYIVVLKEQLVDAAAVAQRQVAAHQGRLHFTYSRALKGYAATLTPAAVTALRADPAVKYIDRDRPMRALGTQSPTPSWGLDRVDQRDLPLGNSYTYGPTGSGVHVYIIDTGIRTSHVDFGGRAVGGADFVGDGNGTNDCDGHGTHVAGTAGGTSYGVAKASTLVAVRVLDCFGDGWTSDVIAGVDWVTANAQKPAAANMSLGPEIPVLIPSLNEAVTNSINSGVFYAVSAGNENADACTTSPASTPAAVTVGATDIADARAWFSNWGSCVDLFGPGVSITSAWITSDGASNTIDGTSMASPHAAGAAALYLEQNPSATPAQVAQALRSNATMNKVTDPRGSPNRLLYTGFLGGSPGGGTWATRTGLPTARRNHAVAVASGLLYAIGGENGAGTVLNSVVAYSPSTNGWTTRRALPAARRTGNGAATLGGSIYVAGGYDAAGALTRTLYAYNTGTNTWSTRASMPVESGCGGSAVISGKLYVFTGCTRSGGGAVVRSGLLHRYDPSTNRWTALRSAPEVHDKPVIGVISGKLYVAGGTTAAGTPSNRLHVYDPATNSWSTKAAMPTARRHLAGTSLGGKLHVVGGHGGGSYLTTHEAYDPATNRWGARAAMPTARSGFDVGGIGGLLYAVGGGNGAGVLATNERYTP